MKVSIITSQLQAEHLKANESKLIKSVNYEMHSGDVDFYNVTIEFSNACTIDIIAQILFSAGITYGLDLKYSSYDNSIPR